MFVKKQEDTCGGSLGSDVINLSALVELLPSRDNCGPGGWKQLTAEIPCVLMFFFSEP